MTQLLFPLHHSHTAAFYVVVVLYNELGFHILHRMVHAADILVEDYNQHRNVQLLEEHILVIPEISGT